jgi:hypothetical protein
MIYMVERMQCRLRSCTGLHNDGLRRKLIPKQSIFPPSKDWTLLLTLTCNFRGWISTLVRSGLVKGAPDLSRFVQSRKWSGSKHGSFLCYHSKPHQTQATTWQACKLLKIGYIFISIAGLLASVRVRSANALMSTATMFDQMHS